MMGKKNKIARSQIEMFCIDDLVPENHLVRKLENAINLDFIYAEVENLYQLYGRESIDPVVLIKIVIIQYVFGIRSMRQTIKEIEVNFAYRWYLGYGLYDKIPHFSTFGKNYKRRFKDTDIFERIFTRILLEADKHGFIDDKNVFIDGTHIKASANNHDCYICPENKILSYSTTNRDGYREYKSKAYDCENCPNRNKCTESKNHVKLITRHIWKNYMEKVEDIRHTRGIKAIYNKRSQTIERVFADAKEKHGMRYTQYRGIAKIRTELSLLFTCMNLKKMALWLWEKKEKVDRYTKNNKFLGYLFEFRVKNGF